MIRAPLSNFEKKSLFECGYKKCVGEFIKNLSNNSIHKFKKLIVKSMRNKKSQRT